MDLDDRGIRKQQHDGLEYRTDRKLVNPAEHFPWDSEDQKKSYLAMEQYRRQFGQEPDPMIDHKMAFLFQKMHEGTEWWRETLIAQMQPQQSQFEELLNEVQRLTSLVEQMQETIAAQRVSIDLLSKRL